jgi:hypothetical protein
MEDRLRVVLYKWFDEEEHALSDWSPCNYDYGVTLTMVCHGQLPFSPPLKNL